MAAVKSAATSTTSHSRSLPQRSGTSRLIRVRDSRTRADLRPLRLQDRRSWDRERWIDVLLCRMRSSEGAEAARDRV